MIITTTITTTVSAIISTTATIPATIGVDSNHRRKYQWRLTITKRKLDSHIGIGSNPNITGNDKSIDYAYQTWDGKKWKFAHYERFGMTIDSGGELLINDKFIFCKSNQYSYPNHA